MENGLETVFQAKGRKAASSRCGVKHPAALCAESTTRKAHVKTRPIQWTEPYTEHVHRCYRQVATGVGLSAPPPVLVLRHAITACEIADKISTEKINPLSKLRVCDTSSVLYMYVRVQTRGV